MLGGDFNKKPYEDAIIDHPDLKVLQTGPTRKDEVLNLVIKNVDESAARTIPPLESDDGLLRSDHLSVYVEANVGSEHRFKWRKIMMRPKTKKGVTTSTKP